MALNYTVYQYDGSRNAVVMTDMEGKQLVIDCDKAEEQVVFDETRDAGDSCQTCKERASKLCEYCNASGWIAGLCGCVE